MRYAHVRSDERPWKVESPFQSRSAKCEKASAASSSSRSTERRKRRISGPSARSAWVAAADTSPASTSCWTVC